MRLIDADALYEKFKNGKSDTVNEKDFNRLARYLIKHAPTVAAAPEVHRALTDIYVRDKSDGSIHRVGDNCHDSLTVENGAVSYYNLQNGEGTGEHGDYEFIDSMWGEMDGGEGE